MRLRPLLAALIFGVANIPILARSQVDFDTSSIPVASSASNFDLGNFTYSFADMGGIQSSGSMNYPGVGQISWDPGTRPEDLFTVGMLSDYGFQNLSLNQIGSVTGQPVSQGSLASFPLVQTLTVSQLAQAVPGLAQTSISQVPPIAALAQQQGILSGGTIGSIAPMIQGPLGQLADDLANYGISQIPGLSDVSLSQLPGIDMAKISDIPGLDQFPLINPLSIKDWFVPFDIGYGMSPCSVTADCHERNIDNTASGNMQNMSIPCMGATQSCAHIEVRRNFGNRTKNIRWISKEQKVSGGSGLGAAICDKEPTGRFPLGPNPKVVLEKIDEAAGKIEFALYFSVHVDLDESDSAHCFGPFPMPFFGTAKEKDWILFGPDTVPKNSPFASMGSGGPGGGGGSCAPAAGSSPPNTQYGHYAYAQADSSAFVSVPTGGVAQNRTESLQPDAATAFNKMLQAASAAGVNLYAISGFRSIAQQQDLWNQQVAQQGSAAAAAKISAPPGYSEHHTGYAIDIGTDPSTDLKYSFENTAAYTWLHQNASTYGFIQSFNGGANQGADNEPWHFRYQGTAAAKQTFSNAASPANTGSAQSGGCDYGGSCITSGGSTASSYKGVNIAAFKNAIASVESLGSGGYSAIGVWVDDGAGNQGRGLGKYQFMTYGPAKAIIAAKPGGQAFLNAVNSPGANTSAVGAQLPQFLTAQEQESLMDNQIRHLVDVGTAQGLTGDRLIQRMAEMHEGGDGVRSGVDPIYSGSVVTDYKKGGCVAGSGISTGKLSYPVNGPITSPFGWRTHPITGEEKFHNGVDFGVAMGTPIHAADGGKVIFAGWDYGGCGNMTIIDHGGGLTTTYCHQSTLNIAVGQAVSKGQIIGKVGSTGSSTGPHLHFTVKKNGQPVDPMSDLQK